MKKAVEQCLQIDSEFAESHLVMGILKMNYEWDFGAANIEFKKAIELNPNVTDAHMSYAICLGLFGNYTKARKHASIAFKLDPFSLMINFHLASLYWMAGDYEKEIEFGRRLIDLDPNFYGGHLHVGRGLMELKRYEEAVPEIEIAVNQNYGSFTLLPLGLLYGVMGEKEKTREVLEKLENLGNTQWVDNYAIGNVYMALGEFDNAIQSFEKVIDKHEGMMLFLKYTIRNFPELGNDPRIKQLIEKIGLPYE